MTEQSRERASDRQRSSQATARERSAPTVGHGDVTSKKIKLESVLLSFDRFVVTRPFCHHSAQIVLSQSLDSISRGHSAQIILVQSLGSISRGYSLALLTRRRSFCRHLIVLSSLDRSVITRSFCHHSTVLSSLGAHRSLAVARLDLSRSLGADRSREVSWLDLSLSLARSPHSAQIILSKSLDSISRSPSTQSLTVARLDLSQSLGSISRNHSLALLTRCRSFSRSYSDRSILQLFGTDHSLAVAWISLSRSLDLLSCGHSTRSLRYSVQIAVTRLVFLRSLDSLFPVTRHGYLSRRYSAWIALSQSLGSISRGHSTLSVAVTRLALCGYSSWIALSQLLGADRSLAVPRIDLSRSLDSLSYSHSTRSLRLLVMDSSLVDTRLGSLSRSHSDRSFAVTRLAFLRSLDSLSTVTRHGSLSRSYSARIALSQSLGLLASLEHDVIPRRHVHPLSIDTSSMATCSDGSEHCPHRSFAQPSQSKKSDQNQKYVDDSSPETVRL
ncbi:hypothetical protein F2Q69_00034714 [Brassica cretica]|uniref:Uncharacterized protein n=1 Tax=Brassica cretica TaxID=69181 RepID=A0A8S9SBQ1_BRACR|nr:hypothetical protein F2Q69_00034714 [Brassica cretica]